MTDSTHESFDTLAKILLRCWIFGFLLLLLDERGSFGESAFNLTLKKSSRRRT